MAKVSLRIYNREIEDMTEQGRIEEAVAHCHHILKTFPKHLETYRLLGKAYLEAKRYVDAADIFLRVLMAVPDDFVSHVGMSLIRDENENMDEAIWHMERAFEAQPANAAVQGELQRLYGRRDGVEPHKIRMTRGALAHMYVQGELYPQAIGEIQGVLAEEPGRVDMQVLLGKAYYRMGQQVEASEICANLLKKYPYSLDANRILIEILPETGRAESTQVYRHRVNSLEPYSAFAKGSIFQVDDVPDAAVNLERLDWQPGHDSTLASGWGDSMGIKLESDVPSQWVQSGVGDDASNPQSASVEQPSTPEDAIPDFMREAGWGGATGAAQEGSLDLDSTISEGDDFDSAEIEQGDVPEWIKSMAPAAGAIAADGLADAGESGDTMGDDWLKDLQGDDEDKESVADEELSNLLDGLGTSADDQDAAMNWLESLAAKQGANPEELLTDPDARTEDAPDWVEQAKEAAEEKTTEESIVAAPVPSGTEPLPAETGFGNLGTSRDIQETASSSAAPEIASTEATPVDVEAPQDDGSVPDWLENLE
ncbi:MAG: tetratricopeptide repeat protein, partial [Anaerolineales bacterium]|nr:tetratricopeptide repeat protein [Anaerolineales bacterium]